METMTTDLLLEEAHDDAAWIEDASDAQRTIARGRAAARVLAELPEGFKIERARGGEAGAGVDRGLEMTLLDERFRPARLLGKVARRRIGSQRITWTGKQLVDPEAAEAFAVVLRLAVIDSEGRRD